MKRTLPIRIDSLKEIRKNNYYYIDKTLMIRDFIDYRDNVALILLDKHLDEFLDLGFH